MYLPYAVWFRAASVGFRRLLILGGEDVSRWSLHGIDMLAVGKNNGQTLQEKAPWPPLLQVQYIESIPGAIMA